MAETFGEEEESILQTAKLWQNNVSAIFGPVETCIHEVSQTLLARIHPDLPGLF